MFYSETGCHFTRQCNEMSCMTQHINLCGRHDSEYMSLCIQSMWPLTVSRVLDDRGLCKQVAPHERRLSCPSVSFLWPSCHQQSLSRPCLWAFGCDLCCHTWSGLHCVNSPCPCSCTLHTHHSSGGVFPSLASSSAYKGRLWTQILLWTLINKDGSYLCN